VPGLAAAALTVRRPGPWLVLASALVPLLVGQALPEGWGSLRLAAAVGAAVAAVGRGRRPRWG
jgi:hypothetical protein